MKAGKFERSKLAQLLNGLDIRITESIERAMETASDETHAIYRFLLKRTQEEEAAGKISQEEAEQERDQHRTRMFGELAVNLLRVSDAMREMQAIEADLRRGQIGDQDAKLKIAELQRQLDPRIQHRHESADYLKKRFLAHRLQLGPLGTEAAKQLSKIEEHVFSRFWMAWYSQSLHWPIQLTHLRNNWIRFKRSKRFMPTDRSLRRSQRFEQRQCSYCPKKHERQEWSANCGNTIPPQIQCTNRLWPLS